MGLPPVVPSTPLEGGNFAAQLVAGIVFAVAIAGWTIRWVVKGLYVAPPPAAAERVGMAPQGPEHGTAEPERVGVRAGGGAG